MHKRQQLGKVVGYHLVIAGETNHQPHYFVSYEDFKAEFERHEKLHRDIYVLIQTNFGNLCIQKIMDFNHVPPIHTDMVASVHSECTWGRANEKDIGYLHQISES